MPHGAAWTARPVDNCMHKPVHRHCMKSVSGSELPVNKLEQLGVISLMRQTIPTRARQTRHRSTAFAVAANALSMRISALIHIFTDYNIQSTTISQGRQ